ncbi:MAG: DUF1080 domain-containing protein [Gemmatimonadaceae bacterium]|nr:DUF1080 domain-containing protein [Gemmatimonadaceae bacterium]
MTRHTHRGAALMLTTQRHVITALLAGASLAACAPKPADDMSLEKPNAEKVVIASFTPLLDSTVSQWREYKTPSGQKGWTFKDGVLSKTGNASDLQSMQQYANFVLEWEWMLEPGGNAGVFYRVTEEYNKPYWSGPEYQLLDDAKHPDGKDSTRTAASAYAIYAPSAKVSKPGGEWNTSRLVVTGTHVEHWLNGTKVVDYELKGADWSAKVKASKFNEYPNYGLASRGYISIQGDHEGQLSIRGMRIQELP